MTDVSAEGRGFKFCRACSGKDLFLALDLGSSPVANSLLPSSTSISPVFPLELRVCADCNLGQIGEFLSPEVLFDDYPYFSSTSQTWLEKSEEFAEQISADMSLSSDDTVLEIASNDGYQLKFFKKLGVRVFGIEPANTVADAANSAGIPTRATFFGVAAARQLIEEGVRPRLIIAKNVLAHVPDLGDFVGGLSMLCSDSTLVAIEAPTILQIFQGNQFDTIYHEHFSYLSATAIDKLFRSHGLELFGAERLGTHGGSVRFLARAKQSSIKEKPGQALTLEELVSEESRSSFGDPLSWKVVQDNVANSVDEFRVWLDSGTGGSVTIGYGAAAKAVTLLAQTGELDTPIGLVIDNSPGKVGKFLPVARAPIVSEQDFVSRISPSPCRYVIFPWNLAAEILPRIRAMDPHAEVIVAVPKLKIL